MNQEANLVHTVAIAEVINRYFSALDQKQFDVPTLARIFTGDAKVVRSNGLAISGPQEIGENQRRSMSRFRATQHLASGFIISLVGDTTADFRANLIAMHLWAEGEGDSDADPKDNYFLAGGVITGRVALGDDGWRIAEILMEPTWRQGTGFQQMLETR